MMWYGNGMSGWGYGLMVTNMIIFWVVVITAIVVLVRYLGAASPHRDGPGPRRVLASRYARGEIDEDEYRRRLRTLEDTDD
ncbi:putative membrane protein [Nocardia transvalensis]|uniref:Putative membrane protein n=1 Tax=Nocardia transvalensis TaxID=37333 RepID=A0A7W9PIG7_9NOCA|nr:SHOCT domain-containing protein [Nocardia transvalensis]MBB5916716.1 putative membrane protein [Nocardia transvalensis]